jgi:CheY-like chemotaxis protein
MRFEGLLVSTDIRVLMAMSEILEDLSIDVDLCMSPSRALDVLHKRDIDLLVVDWDENNRGPEIVETIKNSVCRRVAIVAIVDRSQEGEDAIQAGAHAVIHKPAGPLRASGSSDLPPLHRMVGVPQSSPTTQNAWSAANTPGTRCGGLQQPNEAAGSKGTKDSAVTRTDDRKGSFHACD